VIKNKTIKRGLVAISRHNMWDKLQKRLLSSRSNKTNGIIIILSPNYVAYVPNCRFDLERDKSNTKLACESNKNKKRFGLLFKEAFAEPKSDKVEQETKVEQ
jgi:hypothetical protein